MKKIIPFMIIGMLGLIINANAQEMTVKKAAYFDETPPLREMKQITPGERDRSWKDDAIQNETDPRRKRIDRSKETSPLGPDPLWQKQMGNIRANDPIQNFEGTPNVNGVYPPDTDGDVGPNHYFQMINLSFQIFDKEGNSLYGPVDNSTLWDGFIGPWTGTNDGDPILLYDEEADRWMASQFAVNTDDGSYWELIAISKTPDPTGGYYRYAFEFPAFNDYPKLGVWNDAYYCSFNMFGSYNRAAAAAFDRSAMLEGDPSAQMVLFDLPQGSEPWGMLPADFDGTPPSEETPNYFAYLVDDLYGDEDKIVFWEFEVDWENTSNSTFEEAFTIDVSPFDSEICPAYRGQCIPQPGTDIQLETLADRLMFRLQYRNFGDYQVMLTNHTVDVDGNGHAGIRWYEFRNDNDGDGWYLRQESTYAPDSDNRWMGSIAMNEEGMIALGYSVSSENTYPSIRYTGQGPNAPLGEMIFTEETVIDGSGVQYGDAARWGDYSMMSVDPEDHQTFWFTTEYVEQSGATNWQTRIASFQLEEDFLAPDPVTDLAAETPTTNGVWLDWTATPDNRGEVDEYDLRYSQSPITPENWEDATQVAEPPDPKQPGDTQQFYISGLQFNQEYYFAMKVIDRQNNVSDLSNVVSVTTPGIPDIEASTDTIKKTLHQTLSTTEQYSITNQGESDIRFNTTKRDDIAHNAGEILKSYNSEVSGVLGIQAVDEKFYLVNYSEDQLMVYDTVESAIIDTANVHEKPFGITYDGEHLWIGSKQGQIKAYTLQGDSTGMNIDIGTDKFHAISYNGKHLLVNEVNKDNPDIKAFDTEGNHIKNYQTQIDFDIWQSTWVEQHQSGKLWITNDDGVISQLKLENGIFTKAQTFEAPDEVSYALSHDGTDIIYAEIAGKIHMVDDGVSEVHWLKVSPAKDTIAAQQETVVDLKFVSGDLQPGTYSGILTIHSNDPNEEQIEVPLQLTLLEYNPVQLNATSSVDTVCEETQVEFSADISGGEGDYEVEWSSEPTGFEAETTVVTTRPEAGTKYYVHVTDGIMTVEDSISLNVKPAPDATLGPDTTICKSHTLPLTLNEGYESYQWSDGSEGNTLTIDSTNTENGANIFWANVTGNNGCSVTDTVEIVQEDCAGIAEIEDIALEIYPNPTHNKTHLLIDGQWENLHLSVLNTGGQTIRQRSVENEKGEKIINIDLSGESKGTYYIRLKAEEKSITRKILKL